MEFLSTMTAYIGVVVVAAVAVVVVVAVVVIVRSVDGMELGGVGVPEPGEDPQGVGGGAGEVDVSTMPLVKGVQAVEKPPQLLRPRHPVPKGSKEGGGPAVVLLQRRGALLESEQVRGGLVETPRIGQDLDQVGPLGNLGTVDEGAGRLLQIGEPVVVADFIVGNIVDGESRLHCSGPRGKVFAVAGKRFDFD